MKTFSSPSVGSHKQPLILSNDFSDPEKMGRASRACQGRGRTQSIIESQAGPCCLAQLGYIICDYNLTPRINNSGYIYSMIIVFQITAAYLMVMLHIQPKFHIRLKKSRGIFFNFLHESRNELEMIS